MWRILTLLALIGVAFCGHRCVWVIGKVQCRKDPSQNLNVQIKVFDRDSPLLLQLIDPDDLMGITFANENGDFSLDGCGDDFDWLPGVENVPEPYIQIFHKCNSETGDYITLPEFETFVPSTYELGTVYLDAPSSSSSPSRSLKIAKQTTESAAAN